MFRVLYRDFGSQWRVSHNLRESYAMWFARILWSCVYLMKAAKIAVISMRSEQLGSKVLYEGRQCSISNWAGSASPTLAGENFYLQYADRAKIKNIMSLSELYHRAEFGFSFYMSSWHGIDVNRRLYPNAGWASSR